MKKLIIYLSFVLLLSCTEKGCSLLLGCTEIDCVNNVSALYNKIPYKNEQVIAFKNDTLGIVYDTISIDLNNPGKYDPYSTSDSYSCSCISWITYSNFLTISIGQGNNLNGNQTGIGTHGKDFPFDYDINDSIITYTYNNKLYDARFAWYDSDTLGSVIWTLNVNKDSSFVYTDYIYTTHPEIKLVQYATVYRDGTRRIWRLQE